MFLEDFENMDPIMVMSIVNMKLRNEFKGDFEELTKTYSLDRLRLENKLKAAGFKYIVEIGQFR